MKSRLLLRFLMAGALVSCASLAGAADHIVSQSAGSLVPRGRTGKSNPGASPAERSRAVKLATCFCEKDWALSKEPGDLKN